MGILKGILKKQNSTQDLSEPDNANERMSAANVINFVEIKFAGHWMRRVILGSANAIQYETCAGPRVNRAVVIASSEKGSLKTYRYEFEDGASVIVIGDIVHLSIDSAPSETGSNLL